ncbi:glycogen debranching protein GlgX [Burkholderia pseudomallei]|uniref:glycogen debranching protein GlgX n=1 Tax=Burkholderia pseudomallei TaxID=28450 RepID=UPI000F0762FD|nr:glycogen debranching protein GlgX [Burkholderia pseudomallei]CAJ5299537.1 glycogen operon protein GlgX [Burkholderia pseudomallei]VBE89974.1 glycogen operon protein GlgX [Burkholderia pseudomallei]
MPTPTPDRLEPGRSYPLGAHWDGLGVNFAVFSAHARRVQLCLFDPTGRREIARLDLPECTDEIWHGYLPDAHPGTVYAFRADGAYEPQHGHRFNPHKLLLDPYARKLVGQFRWSDALFGYRLHSSRADLSIDRRDSAPAMPKCVVVDEAVDWSTDRRPCVPWRDTVIYEAHVRGVSMRRAELRAPERGTFAALACPAFIDHLLALGVTSVELLPVHAFMHARALVNLGLCNYWGYDTAAFFAPEPSYLATRRLDEMRIAIRQLHAAGIEVLLDVVYNHTCEGNQLGPTICWRGLDNASYYRLAPDDPRRHIDETGCGNTLDLSHPRVLQMVMDSLRYWSNAFNVDGFRFDLCATLGREAAGFDPGAGFFDALRQDPVLATRKLIAEPWDVGPGGYQLGRHPAGFAEWNDRFRDTVRRFWRGDAGMRPELAARLAGSADLFNHHGRRTWSTVNFVAAHDGFTLADLVSYAAKHNDANGEDNRDGRDDNCSANWGAEGPTEDRQVRAVRARVARSLLTTLFAALGTPMLLGGDEFGRTQQGNNNAYCQDNELSWFDWSAAESADGRTMIHFVGRLAALRRAYPVLSEPRYPSGERDGAPGLHEIDWFDERGDALTVPAWHDRERRALTMRRVGNGRAGRPEALLLMLNASSDAIVFHAPPPSLVYSILLDSAAPDAAPRLMPADGVEIAAHAAVIAAASVPEAG